MNSDPQLIVVDTFAWVEYFTGTNRGETAGKIVENPNTKIFTPDACIGELKFWALTDHFDFDSVFRDVQLLSTILPSNLDDWLSAAEIKNEKRKTTANIGLIDCLLIHHSHKLRAKILTGDSHFKNEKNAILI